MSSKKDVHLIPYFRMKNAANLNILFFNQIPTRTSGENYNVRYTCFYSPTKS